MIFISLQFISLIFIPFLGTTIGAFSVIFMRNSKINDVKKPKSQIGALKSKTRVDIHSSLEDSANFGFDQKIKSSMVGFAAGVMTAASVWSLLIPAMNFTESNSNLGKLSFLPSLIGLFLGMIFLLLADFIILRRYEKIGYEQKNISQIKKNFMLILAVTVHNFPEGMAVGVVLAGLSSGNTSITLASSIALTLGIAIQNLPEGAIVSMPLKTQGYTKTKSILFGVLSGIVEPLGALIVLAFTSKISASLPYMLSFAGGAMLYVVAQELMPEACGNEKNKNGVIYFIIGFAVMMVLDVALG